MVPGCVRNPISDSSFIMLEFRNRQLKSKMPASTWVFGVQQWMAGKKRIRRKFPLNQSPRINVEHADDLVVNSWETLSPYSAPLIPPTWSWRHVTNLHPAPNSSLIITPWYTLAISEAFPCGQNTEALFRNAWVWESVLRCASSSPAPKGARSTQV